MPALAADFALNSRFHAENPRPLPIDQVLGVQRQPGSELNARVVGLFKSSRIDAESVMRVTSACIASRSKSWEDAVSCLAAVDRLVDGATGKPLLANTISYNAAISVCARLERWDKALALFEHLKTWSRAGVAFPDATSYTLVLGACIKAGRQREVLELITHLQSEGRRYNIVLDRESFVKVLSILPGSCPELTLVRHLYENGVFPDVVTCNAAISSLAKGGRWEEAVGLFEQLQREGPLRGVFPDIISYNATLSAYVKGGQCDRALGMFRMVTRLGAGVGIFPTSSTYNTLICACSKDRRWADAVALFQDLQQRGPALRVFPELITCNATLSACAKAGRWEEALHVLSYMQEHGRVLDFYPSAQSYALAIEACETGGRIEMSATLLRQGIDGTAGEERSKVFSPNLGFDPQKNALDLHQRVVHKGPLKGDARNPTVHPAVARAIFRVLLADPEKILGKGQEGINRSTTFVVGQHGTNATKDTICACMEAEGWSPIMPVDHSGACNPGRLISR